MKYERDNFANLFALRQYGPFLRERGTTTIPPATGEEPFFSSCEPYYQTLIDLARRYVTPSSICLDIGCGPGRLVGEFSRLGSALSIGIDTSFKMTQLAQTILTSATSVNIELRCNFGVANTRAFEVRAWGLSNVRLVRSSAEALPLGTAQADLVCCANVLTRLRRPVTALGEIRRVLKPGGAVAGVVGM